MRTHAANMKLNRLTTMPGDNGQSEKTLVMLEDERGNDITLSFRSLYAVRMLANSLLEAEQQEFQRLMEQKKVQESGNSPAPASTESAPTTAQTQKPGTGQHSTGAQPEEMHRD